MITKIILISTVAGLKTVDRSDVQLKQSLIEDAGQDDWTGVLEDNVGSVDSLTPKIRHLGVLKSIKDFMSQVITFIAQLPENLYLKFKGEMLRPRKLRYGLRIASVVVVPLIVIGAIALVVKGINYFFIQSGSSPDTSGSYRPSSRPASGSSVGGGSGGDFKTVMLNAHNLLRCMYGAKKLKWKGDMGSDNINAGDPKKWVDKLKREGFFDHWQKPHFCSSGTDPRRYEAKHCSIGGEDKQGENLSSGSSATQSVINWWGEVYTKNQGMGHFTQVVWKDTKELNCAQSGTIVSCRYQPPGNYQNYLNNGIYTSDKVEYKCKKTRKTCEATIGWKFSTEDAKKVDEICTDTSR